MLPFFIMIMIMIVIMTMIIIIAPLATTFMALAARFAFLHVAVALTVFAAVPVRPGNHVYAPYGLMRIVTFNHQFAGFARALNRVILNNNIEGGAGMQWRWERIVYQVEVLVV